MGMYDELRCKYPLPVAGANDLLFQTKDTREQYLDMYEIREDGTLWHQPYTTEDRSDPNANGIAALFGCATRVPGRWEQDLMTGEVRFYTDTPGGGWLEFSAYFVKGHLKALETIEASDVYTNPAPIDTSPLTCRSSLAEST